MDLRNYLRAIKKSWWLVVLLAVIGGGAGVLATERATPVYQSVVTFFVSTPSDGAGTPLQADQYVQARINSYLLAMNTEKFADLVQKQSGVELTKEDVQSKISDSTELESVIIRATVSDSIPDRSLAIATAVASQFGPFIQSLDIREKDQAAPVELNVISGPTLNPTAVSPTASLNIGLGILVGLIIGVGVALIRQRLDNSISSLDALQELSGQPVLGGAAFDRGAKQAPVLAREQMVRSLRAEAFRRVRTNIQFVGVDNPAQVIVVTSSVAGEGRTTTAANLAGVYAESGQKVLLIEGDMRGPAIAGYLGLRDTPGLSDVLARRIPVQQAIQLWPAGGFAVLTSGAVPLNPSELLGSDLMVNLIGELRQTYDVVIVDTPAVNAVTDAVVASTWSDGVVLVVRSGKTPRAEISTALQWLGTVDAYILGSVLNMRPSRGGDADGYNETYYSDEAGPGLLNRTGPQRASVGARAGR